jgi:FkbM family methyltransferase
MPHLNKQELSRWKIDRGDQIHILNHRLDSNSVVIDIGGYTGKWAEEIIKKYDPYVYIIEPVPQFYQVLTEKFKDNPKVTLLNVGVSNQDKKDYIFLNRDNSSIFSNTSSLENSASEKVEVSFLTMKSLLTKINRLNADLIQVNIEGAEYSLLEHMIEERTILNFVAIQIQFHLGIESAESRREKIIEKMQALGFKNIFSYPNVWEGWRLENV